MEYLLQLGFVTYKDCIVETGGLQSFCSLAMSDSSAKKKVLYINPNGFVGGAEQFVLEIAKGHKQRNKLEVEILFFTNGEGVKIAQENGIKTTVLPLLFRLRNPIRLLRIIFFLRKYVRSIKPDIVHLTMGYSHLILYPALIGLKVKTVWFQHGPVGGFVDRTARLLPCDIVMFNSFLVQKEHMELFGPNPKIGERKIHAVVPFKSKKPDRMSEIRAELLSSGQKKIIGMAGRITRWKGFHVFVDAIILLQSKQPDLFSELKFIIIGKANNEIDQSYEDNLRKKISAHGLEQQINFLGFVDDIHNYYGAMDIFVHASVTPEPFGLVVAEVMLQETAVIGSCHGGINEILIDGKTGQTFDSMALNAAELLCAKLYEYLHPLAEGEHSSQLQIKAARALIEQNYLSDQVTNEVEQIYTELLEHNVI